MKKTSLSSLPPSLRAEAARQLKAQRVAKGKGRVPKAKKTRSPLETRFAREIASYAIPQPVEEYEFCPDRKWRADFAWPDQSIRLLVEIEGGIHQNGRHNRVVGYVNDCEKYNWAQEHGWTVLRYAGRLLPGAPRQVAEYIAGKLGLDIA